MLPLRARLMFTFVPLILGALCLSALAIWYLLESSQTRQMGFIDEVLRQDARLHMQNNENTLRDALSGILEAVTTAGRRLSTRADFIAFVGKSQAEPLQLLLRHFTETNGLDFALVLDLDGQLLATSPGEVDDYALAQALAASPFLQQIQAQLHDQDPHHTQLYAGFERFDTPFLPLQLLAERGEAAPQPAPVSLGPVSAHKVLNPYGEPIGWLLAGVDLRHRRDALAHAAQLSNARYLDFIDGQPHLSIGIREALPPLAPAQLAHLPDDARTFELDYHTRDQTYRLNCWQLLSPEGVALNLNCVGQPRTDLLRVRDLIDNMGTEVREAVNLALFSIGATTLLGMLLASLYLAHRFTRPIKQMTRAMSELAEGRTEVSMPTPEHSQELAHLGAAMEVFRDNALKRREMEAQLREANQQLQHNIQQLEEAKRRSEVAEVAKREFLTAMSHELKTPLNAILGFAQVLHTELQQEDGEAGPRRDLLPYVAQVLKSGKHLLYMVDDIIDISSSVQGRLALNETHFRPCELLQLAYIQLLPEARQHGVSMALEPPLERLPTQFGDTDRLRQALRHIIDNAVKFTPAQGRVTLSCDRREDGGVDIYVRDTGIGMSEEVQQAAFTLFKQGDGGLSRRYGGLGMGLSLAHIIVTLHGGEIRFQSRPGEGTEVRLCLPAERSLPADAVR